MSEFEQAGERHQRESEESEFDGARRIAVDKQGDLELHTASGIVKQKQPFAYQEVNGQRRQVAASYVLQGKQQVGFGVGAYDPALPLVIDPVLSYSTYLGGAKLEGGYDIAVDVSGNIYIAGFTASTDFPLSAAPYDAACGGCLKSGGDAFITKIDPSQSGAASLVYSTYLGADTSSSQAEGIAVDASGNVYVTGWTTATDFPTTANALHPTDGPFADGFVTKLDASGSTLRYSTYLIGNNVDEGLDIAVDGAGMIYVTGRSASSNFVMKNAYQTVNAGFDAIVMKINPFESGAASLLYSTFLGGHTSDGGRNIAVDAAGHVYITGETQSRDLSSTPQYDGYPVKNAYQPDHGGGTWDAFMTKLDPSQAGGASLLYSTYIGGGSQENSTVRDGGIAVDASGNAYVIGTTTSADFPLKGAIQSALNGGQDAVIIKIDPSQSGAASHIYSTYLGGSFAEYGTDIAVDSFGKAHATGVTLSSNFPTSTCAFPKNNSNEAFVSVLNPAGSALVYSTYLGGNGPDFGYAIVVDASGNVYVGGDTDSSNFPTANAFDQTFGGPCPGCGGRDAFVTKIGGPLKCNLLPVISNQSVSTAEDVALPVTLGANDGNGSDLPPDTLTYTVVTGPSHGTLSSNSGVMTAQGGSAYSAEITYTPHANYNGPDSFTFKVNDGTVDSGLATVSITVTPVNDAPAANSQSVTTAEDMAVPITLTGNDVEGSQLTYIIAIQPANGTLSGAGANLTYTPNPNYNGPDSFTFIVNDGALSSMAATVSITVTPVNDAPVASNGQVMTNEDTAVGITLVANDIDNVNLSYVIIDQPLHGVLVPVVGGTFTYFPDPDYNGPDSFTFKANDGQADSNVATFSITVNPVADPPVLASVGVKVVLEGALLAFNLSGYDPDGDALTFSATGLPAGATLDPATGAFSWTPNFTQSGVYPVTFTVTDPTGLSASETIQITVIDVVTNQGPNCSTAIPSIGVIWPPNHSETHVINILGVTDPDGDPVAIKILRILQDEPTNTLGDGNTWIDGGGVGTSQAWVRAERSGKGNGRIYEIFFEASDGKGGICSGSVKVSVPHNQSQPAVDDGRRYDSTVAGGPCLNCN